MNSYLVSLVQGALGAPSDVRPVVAPVFPTTSADVLAARDALHGHLPAESDDAPPAVRRPVIPPLAIGVPETGAAHPTPPARPPAVSEQPGSDALARTPLTSGPSGAPPLVPRPPGSSEPVQPSALRGTLSPEPSAMPARPDAAAMSVVARAEETAVPPAPLPEHRLPPLRTEQRPLEEVVPPTDLEPPAVVARTQLTPRPDTAMARSQTPVRQAGDERLHLPVKIDPSVPLNRPALGRPEADSPPRDRPSAERIIPVQREPAYLTAALPRPVGAGRSPLPGLAPAPPGPPTIRVSIGRIEVRALMPPPPLPAAPSGPSLTLEAYLNERTGRRDR
jgi:hypothetical protein